MKYLLIRNKVADFPKWKRVYSAHVARRQSAGLKELHLLHSVDGPDEVVLLFKVKNITKAKAMLSSADLRMAMKKAGVIGKPDFFFLK
jgi:hypothetical protein